MNLHEAEISSDALVRDGRAHAVLTAANRCARLGGAPVAFLIAVPEAAI